MNQANIIGNLGGDSELQYISTGTPKLAFNVAVNEPKLRDGADGHTEWFSCIWWGYRDSNDPSPCEKLQKFLLKGKKVFVSGKLQTHDWEDDDGVKHYKTELIVRDVELLGDREGGGGGGQRESRTPEPQARRQSQATPAGDIDVDDLPFE